MISENERALLKRLLSEPDELPNEFKEWLIRYLEMNPPNLLLSDISLGTPSQYKESNVTVDRTYDANLTTLAEVADVLGTLIEDLRTKKIVG